MFYCIFQGGSFLAILKAYAVELLYVIEKKWHWKIVFNIIIVKITLQFCQVSLTPCAEDVIITTPPDDKQYYAIRILKCTDEEGGKKIKMRQQREKEHRRAKRLGTL